MSEKKNPLFTLLKNIQGSGQFTSSKVNAFTPPDLYIDGFGELAFPVNEIQARAIIKLAAQAPFGRGSQTLIDTDIRNSWEIDAGLLSLRNSSWDAFMKKVITKVKKDLGISKTKVEASLYKLLIYEEGGFFKTHKDSEKEPGMFATLVITLPSKYTGGQLCVRFDGKEEVFDFSKAASDFKLPYAAFFADCDHEVKPLDSGYRFCLVYNLIQTKGKQPPTAITGREEVEQIIPILESMKDAFTDKPLAVLLDHQYTPANFAFDSLKSHDKPRVTALMEAAEKAGYFASLGLVTHYIMGDLEGGDYYDGYGYGRYRSYRHTPEDGTMGDVHEITTTIEHWSDDGFPSMGEIHLDKENILTDIEIGTGKPIEQEEEGFTGNAGMTMEYWYHYGALILWPKNQHATLLMTTEMPVWLGWLRFYMEQWDNEAFHSPQYTRELLSKFELENIKKNYRYERLDFTPLASAFVKLGDEAFLKDKGLSMMQATFKYIDVAAWCQLLQLFNPNHFTTIFQELANSGKKKLNHLLDIFLALLKTDSGNLRNFVEGLLEQLPVYIRNAKIHKLKRDKYEYIYGDESTEKDISKAILIKSLQLSQLMEENVEWMAEMLAVFTKVMPRTYVNDVLVDILLKDTCPKGKLADNLLKESIIDLKKRVNKQPQPPADWRRKVPTSKYDQKQWEVLRSFLESPTLKVFDYRKNQSYRSNMASAIAKVKIDLKQETIKKGTPHTLRLTKTQGAYELKLSQWKKDVELLDKMGEH